MAGKTPYVAIPYVPEGPTGSGVVWALLDWLPPWRDEFVGEFNARGVPLPDIFNFFLLEFVPASPDSQEGGGNRDNVLQGYMSREALYDRVAKSTAQLSGASDEERTSEGTWPFYWFRFDGAKFHRTDNRLASRIGTMVMSLVLTSEFSSATGSREGTNESGTTVELVQALDDIGALEQKPVEVMLSAINLPIDEQGCNDADALLKTLDSPGANMEEVPEGSDELAGRWQKFPEIEASLAELKATINEPRYHEDRLSPASTVPLLLAGAAALVIILVALVMDGIYAAPLVFDSGAPAEQGVPPQPVDPFAEQPGTNIAGKIFAAIIIFISLLAIVGALWLFKHFWDEKKERQGRIDAENERIALATEQWQRNHNNSLIAGRKTLRDTVRNSLANELDPGLESDRSKKLMESVSTRIIGYGDWYVKVPFTPENDQFKEFLQGKPVADIVDHNEQPTVWRRFSENIREKIIANNWLTGQTESEKKVMLIPIGNAANQRVFEVTGSDVNLGADARITPTYAGDSGASMSYLYVILRNPVEIHHVANRLLYESVYNSTSDEQRIRRKPGTQLLARVLAGEGVPEARDAEAVETSVGAPPTNTGAPTEPPDGPPDTTPDLERVVAPAVNGDDVDENARVVYALMQARVDYSYQENEEERSMVTLAHDHIALGHLLGLEEIKDEFDL